MHMSTPYELSGRTRQKQRTRIALVTAARELVARGETPTVDEAAASASVSRTTAYRYFPNQRSLLVAAHPEIEARSLLPDSPQTMSQLGWMPSSRHSCSSLLTRNRNHAPCCDFPSIPTQAIRATSRCETAPRSDWF